MFTGSKGSLVGAGEGFSFDIAKGKMDSSASRNFKKIDGRCFVFVVTFKEFKV